MKVEVSCLFRTDYHQKEVIRAQIGDNVWIEKIVDEEWLKDALEKQPRLGFKQEMGWRPFTHRFFVTVQGTNDKNDSQVKNAQELICQAIVLSRIVRPTPIAMRDAWVWTIYTDGIPLHHEIFVGAGFCGEAYVTNIEEKQRIEEDDANQMAQLWPRFHQFFVNEPQHRRIVRALKYFDIGYHISNAEQRHLTFHAALESLICTKNEGNKSAVITRLPQLVPKLKQADAESIYKLCCEIKHEAAPIFRHPSADENIDASDRDRMKATQLLEEALRELFRRSITEAKITNALCNQSSLMRDFPLPKKAKK